MSKGDRNAAGGRMLLKPTGHCFDDALDFLEYVVRGIEQPEFAADPRVVLDGFVIVHAICFQPIREPYAHAWVEEGDRVWQGGILDDRRVFFAVERNQFYRARAVWESTRYTWSEALEKNWATNHFGPWEEKYMRLCREVGDPMRMRQVPDQTVVKLVLCK